MMRDWTASIWPIVSLVVWMPADTERVRSCVPATCSAQGASVRSRSRWNVDENGHAPPIRSDLRKPRATGRAPVVDRQGPAPVRDAGCVTGYRVRHGNDR
jgi:hypothetical protein